MSGENLKVFTFKIISGVILKVNINWSSVKYYVIYLSNLERLFIHPEVQWWLYLQSSSLFIPQRDLESSETLFQNINTACSLFLFALLLRNIK